jgi:arsenate reductase-like glutaredoxin family protein
MNDQTDSNPGGKKEPTIIIYCKEWCTYLRQLTHLLQEKQWSFTFFDLRFDSKKAKDLISKLGNPLILPILDINGTYFEKPSLSKVGETLDLIRWRQQVDRTYYGTKSPGVH